MPVRILITDDHEIVREGIRTLIARSRPEWEICGEATNGEEAIAACRTLKPDVIILDVTMPRMSGLEAASQISTLNLGCRVLIFTMHESERLSEEVQQTGAQGFVLKSQAARDLIRAIDIILKGGTFFGSGPKDEEDTSGVGPSTFPSDRSHTAQCILSHSGAMPGFLKAPGGCEFAPKFRRRSRFARSRRNKLFGLSLQGPRLAENNGNAARFSVDRGAVRMSSGY